MNQKIREILPEDIEYYSPDGGLSFWIKLPLYIDMNSLYYKTQTKGLQYVPGSVFSTRKYPVNNYIRLSFAQTDERSIEQGLNILAYCIQDIKANKPVRSWG
jgi:DNA-binding transcriptional MocR family regulator